MVAVVAGGRLFVLGPTEWRRAPTRAIASLLYVSNLVFAVQATNYFAADLNSSLFLHTWSLGVEEQFYLVWPRAAHVRRLAGAVVAAGGSTGVVAALLGAPSSSARSPSGRGAHRSRHAVVVLQPAHPGVGVRRRRPASPASPGGPCRVSARAHAVLGVAGLAPIAAVGFVLSDATPFAGRARPCCPSLGTMALLFSGDGRAPVAGRLGAALARRSGSVGCRTRGTSGTGRSCCSRWPGSTRLVGVRAGGVVVALGVAWVARRLVENPIRFSAAARRPARPDVRRRRVDHGRRARRGPRRQGRRPAQARRAVLRPPGSTPEPTPATRTTTRVCETQRSPRGVRYCAYGDPHGTTTVMLTGDSHAAHWIPAFDPAGERRSASGSSCTPAVDARRCPSGRPVVALRVPTDGASTTDGRPTG